MATKILARLPEDFQFHVITFCNGCSIPYVSKKFYEYWVQAGLVAIQECHQNSLVGRNAQNWDWGPVDSSLKESASEKFRRFQKVSERVDAFLRALAKQLFPRQTILPISYRMNLNAVVRDRNSQALVRLDRWVVTKGQRDLIALADWLAMHTARGSAVLDGWRVLPTLEAQAHWIAAKLRESGETIRVSQSDDPGLNLVRQQDFRELSALPREFVHLDAEPAIIQEACNLSVKRGQVPFMEVVACAHKTEVVSLEEVVNWLKDAAFKGNAELVIHLLKDRRLRGEQRAALEYAAKGNAGPLEDRLRLINALIRSLGDTEFKNELKRALCVACSNGATPFPYQKAIVQCFLANPAIDSSLVDSALDSAIADNPDSFPLENRLAILRIIISHRLCTTKGKESALGYIVYWGSLQIRDRLAVLGLLLAQPISKEAKKEALRRAIHRVNLSIQDRRAVIRYILTGETIDPEDLGLVLSDACNSGTYSLQERFQLMEELLEDHAVTSLTIAIALRNTMINDLSFPPLSLSDRRAVVQKLRSDPRITADVYSSVFPNIIWQGNINHPDRMAMIELIFPSCSLGSRIEALKTASFDGILSIQQRSEIIFFLLSDPLMTAEGCGEALNFTTHHGEMSLQDRFALIDLLRQDARITQAHKMEALEHATCGGAFPIEQRLEVVRFLLADRSMTAEGYARVLRVTTYHGRISLQDRLAVMDLLCRDARITQAHKMEALEHATCVGALPIEQRLEVVRFLLADRSMTTEGSKRVLFEMSFYGTMSLQDRLVVMNFLCQDPRFTVNHQRDLLYALVRNDSLSMNGNKIDSLNSRLALIEALWGNPQLSADDRFNVLLGAVKADAEQSSEAQRAVIRLLLSDFRYSLTDQISALIGLERQNRSGQRVSVNGMTEVVKALLNRYNTMEPMFESHLHALASNHSDMYDYSDVLKCYFADPNITWRSLNLIQPILNGNNQTRLFNQLSELKPPPFSVNAFLGFERFWSFLTSPLRYVFGGFTDVLLWPVTFFRWVARYLIMPE